MSQPYSQDLRVRVLHALETSGLKRAEVAQQYQVCPATLYKWQKQKRVEKRVRAKPHAGGKVSRFDLHVLRDLVEEQNDRTLEELASAYAQKTGTAISKSSVDRLLSQGKVTRKKKSGTRH
jgi:transposase